jgi:hypothetical protein
MLVAGDGPGAQVLLDPPGQVSAHPGDFQQFLVRHFREVPGQPGEVERRLAVCPDLERVVLLDLHDVGNFLE